MKTKKTKVKTCVLAAISIFAIVLATVTGVVNFGLTADAATGSDTSAAEYGETLGNQKPDDITDKTWAYTPSDTTGWSWVDSADDYFGNAGKQTFVVQKSSDNNIAYNAITITVKPRTVRPTLKFNSSGSQIPDEWAGNSSKAKTDDSAYKMTITGSTNNSTMGTVTGGGTYWKGQPFTLTAAPKTGYKFNGWSGGSTSTNATLDVSNVYSNTTYAATFEEDSMKVTSSLPTKKGEVSIMTIEQAYVALGGNTSSSETKYDPNPGYSSSTYYMYGIVGSNGSNSKPANLKAVGLDWYQKLKKPTSSGETFSSNDQAVFGGPLYYVDRNSDGTYYFYWYYSGCYYISYYGSYWNSFVSGSVYVAVVHK